jgi:hypothetical protein
MKFKIGDKVRVVKWDELPDIYYRPCYIGMVGTIYGIKDRHEHPFYIKDNYDNFIDSFYPQELELLIKPGQQLEFDW